MKFLTILIFCIISIVASAQEIIQTSDLALFELKGPVKECLEKSNNDESTKNMNLAIRITP